MAHVTRIKKRSRWVWIADYVDATGRRCRLQFATREKAEDHLAEAIKEVLAGKPVSVTTAKAFG